MKMGALTNELSTVGLRVANGTVLEDVYTDLKWPNCKATYNKMWLDPVIASANQTIKAFVRNAKYKVVVENDSPDEKDKANIEFIESCMNDMEESFNDYINESLSFLKYGFCVNEKVFKYRNNKGEHKSRHSDEKIGWAKLPVRSQDSISRWRFDNKGRNLLSVEQNLSLVCGSYDYKQGGNGFSDNIIDIPRQKFMLFRHDTERNSPIGTSPLRACYSPWKYKAQIEEYQSAGISRDLGGLPVIKMPIEYLSDDAPDDKKQVYQMFKDIIMNLHNNQQAGLILPRFIDEVTKMDLFDFELVSTSGGKMYDTTKIISNYENKILMTYLADVLKLGQDASGSFALSDNKTNLLAIGIKSIIEEILQEFNRDLIPQTMRLNGEFDASKYPKITVEDLDERDLEKLGKFIQQTVSVGAVETDQTLSEWLRKEAGAPPVDRDKPLDPKLVAGGGDAPSRAGDGMATKGEGTATKVSGGDKATGNASI
jgi:hypothetical protein